MTRDRCAGAGVLLLLASLLASCATPPPPFALAIHGGAGTMARADLTPELEHAYRAALADALQRGYAVLDAGGSAVDAVVAAITPLEDSPLFNAGVGAVFTAAAEVELDASIMDGRTKRAGAVAAVRTVQNPITLARAVMDASPHVMLVGAGAEAFAAERGIARVPNETFHTERRRQQLEEARAAERAAAAFGCAHAAQPAAPAAPSAPAFGTVGCVALDRNGHLAAGTSTGGMTNKRFGRVGDAPIIGAGTYADDATCAVSATGHGEFFMRAVAAHAVAQRMQLAGEDLASAARTVLLREVGGLGGSGGMIALDARGNVAAPFNTPGMYRGWMRAGEAPAIHIFGDDER